MIKSDKGNVKIIGTGLIVKNELADIFKALRENLGVITFDLVLSDALATSKETKNKTDKEIDKLMKELERIIKKL